MPATLVGVYLILTLPVLPMLAANVAALRWLFFVDLSVRAVPLYVAWLVDVAVYDGGELSHAMIPLWVVLTGVLLWPLTLLAVRPGLWWSNGWRTAITAYTAVVAVATMVAARWVFTHLGVFF